AARRQSDPVIVPAQPGCQFGPPLIRASRGFGSAGRFGSTRGGNWLYPELVARRGIDDPIDVEAVLLLELRDSGGSDAVVGAGLRGGDLGGSEGALHRAHVIALQSRLGRAQLARLARGWFIVGKPAGDVVAVDGDPFLRRRCQM